MSVQQLLIGEIFSLVRSRSASQCNFLHGSSLLGGEDVRVVYRHYATLYFCFVVDDGESCLGMLDLIQVFVEALDKVFGDVCELDLIFHFDDVHAVLGECVVGGLVADTTASAIVAAFNEHKRTSGGAAGGGSAKSRGLLRSR